MINKDSLTHHISQQFNAELEEVRSHLLAMGGYVAQEILNKGPDVGRDAIAKLRECFDPGHFFVELQDHGFPENRPLNQVLGRLARELELLLMSDSSLAF